MFFAVATAGVLAVAVAHDVFVKSVASGLSDEYDEIAINVIEHGAYSASPGAPERLTVTRGPIYPLYLAGIFSVFGTGNIRAVAVADMLVLAVTAALITAMLSRLVPIPAALAAGAFYAFWPATFYYAGKGSSETMLALWFVASLVLLVRLRNTGRARLAAALGVALALACLTRGSAVMLLGVSLVVVLLQVRAGAMRWTAPAALVIAFALVMSPWWIRNYRVTGTFVPFHSLLWYNAYHDDVFDRAHEWLAAEGRTTVDWGRVDAATFPPSVPKHPPGFTYPAALHARDDLAQEGGYRAIMLERFRSPAYLIPKLGRNAVDFWSASASVAKGRLLLGLSAAWLLIYATALAVALRARDLRWLALAGLATVLMTWAVYLPFLAIFRHALPSGPFIAITVGLAAGAWLKARARDSSARVSGGPGSAQPSVT